MLTRQVRVAFLAVLCVGVAPALATPDLAVVVDSSETEMMITGWNSANSLTGVVLARDADSRMTAEIQNTNPPYNTLDGIRIDGYSMALTFHFLGAGDAYTANGSFKLGDVDPTVTYDMQADFTSTSVSLATVGGQKRLEMQGRLSTMSGNPSILIGTDPWVFTGTASDGSPNGDGVLTTITVNDPSGYTSGGLVALHYPVYGDYASLEALFGALQTGDTLVNGSVHATTSPVVPAPGAALLGLLGVAGVAGLKLRKWA